MAMNRKEEINKDLRSLITSITGLHSGDENFRLCVDFADSNFRYHRYLSPDSHKIGRAVDGLCEKFRVHSQLSKADDLKELTCLFLDQVGLEGRDHGKTNTHYALLSLLIELSEKPTSTSFHRTEHIEKDEEVDDFDWKAYLLDPQDVYFISHASSDSEEEELSDNDTQEKKVAWVEEIVKEGEEDELDRLQIQNSDMGDDSHTSLQTNSNRQGLPVLSLPANESHDSARQSSNDYRFLEDSLVVEYWKGKGREEDCRGGHSSSNLAKDWTHYQQRVNEFHTPSATVFVTEAQVMREALWMLSGVCDLFVFTHDQESGQFGVNPDIYVSHLTPESLSSFLQPLMDTAGQMYHLQGFVKSVVSHTSRCGDDHHWGTPRCQTYQAFAGRVWAFLTEFKTAVKGEEKIVMAQEEMMSLNKLCTDLRPWFAKLSLVYSVFVRGVKASEHIPGVNNAIRTSLLLNTLYQVLHEIDPVDSVEEGSKSELVLQLLMESHRPLLDITSNWITNGQLSDAEQEFVVQRNKQIKSLDETFWEKAFVSHLDLSTDAPPQDIALKNQNPTGDSKTNLLKTTPLAEKKEQSLSHLPNNKDNDFLLSSSYSPIFLQASLKDTLVTGKSMEVLENLGRLGDVLPGHLENYSRPPSLYESLVQDLNKTFSSGNEKEDSLEFDKDKLIGSTLLPLPTKDPVVHNLLNARGSRDTLLNINFNNIFPSAKSPSVEQQSKRSHNADLKVSAMLASNVLRHAENCLQGYVRCRYDVVCPRLVEILKTEYKLVDCIHAMQRYYLMSDGDIMSDFCYPIFNKMDCREPWQDPNILDMYLHEAIGRRYPEDTERLRVEIVPLSKAKGPINATDCIHLKYQVEWPVDVVISGKCEDRYNSIFSFLIQIKRAKSSLEQLRFEDMSRDPGPDPVPLPSHLGVPMPPDPMDTSTRTHRLHLLRFRLVYFVNSLHNYIMTRILHTSGLEFSHRLEKARDLDEIISIHSHYLDIIHERCLLHPQLAYLKNAIVEILNLSLTCSTQWRQGSNQIKGSFIQEMEMKLTRCVNFLSSFLVNVIKRGSFPQLESLAVALTSMHQVQPDD